MVLEPRKANILPRDPVNTRSIYHPTYFRVYNDDGQLVVERERGRRHEGVGDALSTPCDT